MGWTNDMVTLETLMELQRAQDETSRQLVRITRMLEEQNELLRSAQTLVTAGTG